MSGWIQTAARAQFSAKRTSIPESVVAVVVNGKTANGIKDSVRGVGSLDAMGERGVEAGTVSLNASEIDEPELGSSILVGGAKAIVQNVKTDPAGALLAVEYQLTREQE